MKKNSVFLRAFEPDDYLLINQWRNDFNVQKLVVGRFRYVSPEREKQWVESKMTGEDSKDTYLAVCLNDDSKRMIGYVSVNNIDYINRKAHNGAMVLAGEGRTSKHLTDTYLLLFDFVFVDLSLHRLSGSYIDNHKKARLMNKMMGWKIEGIEKEAVFKNQAFHDIYHIAMLDSEYFEMLNNGEFEDCSLRKRMLEAVKEENK